ncbi:MAG: TolC family protein [Sedimentisphaerales bacterium]|nr:TolC family protein [Sedimentisphaerales bacterium]
MAPLEGPLTLAEAIGIALVHNPDIAAAGWDSEAARARYDYAVGARWPRLSAVGSYAHHLDEQRLLPVRQPGDPAILSRDIVSGDLVLTMPIFTGGRLINQIEAAEFLQQAAGHRLARNREELVFNVSSVFLSILAQRQVIESLEFSGRTLEQHLDRVDALIATQKAARVDRLRTEVRLADVQQRLVRERNVLAIQHRALASLLGSESQGEALSIQGDLELDEGVSVPELETALTTAWSGRDDYLAARSTLEAQVRNVEAARAGHLPVVFVQGSYGGRWAAGSPTGTGNELDDIGRIGLGAEIPLYQGGQVNAQVQEQRANLAAARERLRKLELQIRLDLETALLNVRSSLERIGAIQTAVDQAQESLRIEREKYDLGRGAIIDVLDAQSALLDSQTNYYRALADYHVATAQMKLAMGGQ